MLRNVTCCQGELKSIDAHLSIVSNQNLTEVRYSPQECLLLPISKTPSSNRHRDNGSHEDPTNKEQAKTTGLLHSSVEYLHRRLSLSYFCLRGKAPRDSK